MHVWGVCMCGNMHVRQQECGNMNAWGSDGKGSVAHSVFFGRGMSQTCSILWTLPRRVDTMFAA